MGRWLAVAVVLAALGVTAGAHAEDLGNDEVTLKNGGMLRGTVVAVEPDKQVTIVVSGEKRTVPWAEVDQVERGKYGKQEPEPAAEPEPELEVEPEVEPEPDPKVETSSEPPPPPPGEGVVRLHIFTDDPNVELHRYVGGGFTQVGSQLLPNSYTEFICKTPCDTILDGRRGELFYFAGDGVSISQSFDVKDAAGDVGVNVDPGNATYRTAGSSLLYGGLGVIAAGALMLGLNGISDSGRDDAVDIAGATVLATGGAMFVGGILFLSVSGTDFEFVTPKEAAQ